MKISNLACLSAVALLAACGSQGTGNTAAATSKTVATINGKTISQETFDAIVKALTGKTTADLPVKDRDQVLDEVVRSEVVAQQAEKDGLDKKGDAASQLALARMQILQTAAAEAFLKDKKSTDAEIQKEYDSQIESLPKLQYKAHHILVKTEAEALAALARINKGEKFEAVAKSVSIDTSKDNGGDLGDFFSPASMVPPFAAAVQAMKKGEVSAKPVQTDFGFHIIRLDDTRPTTPPALASVKDRVDQIVQQKKFKAYTDELMKAAKVEKSL